MQNFDIDADNIDTSSIDYKRPHLDGKEGTRDLLCQLTEHEQAIKGKEYAAQFYATEDLEAEAAASAKRHKGAIEVSRGKAAELLRIVQTGKETRPISVFELWGKRNGEDVLIAVRKDRYHGIVDSDCYVGWRYPQPLDRQFVIKGVNTSSDAREANLQRQADAALASADPMDADPLPFEEDDERDIVAMEGAAPPEDLGAAKPKRKSSTKPKSTKAKK